MKINTKFDDKTASKNITKVLNPKKKTKTFKCPDCKRTFEKPLHTIIVLCPCGEYAEEK